MSKTDWLVIEDPTNAHQWRVEVYTPEGRLRTMWNLDEPTARLIAAAPRMRDWIKAQIPRIEGAGEAREWTGYEGIVDEGNAILRKAGAIE